MMRGGDVYCYGLLLCSNNDLMYNQFYLFCSIICVWEAGGGVIRLQKLLKIALLNILF